MTLTGHQIIAGAMEPATGAALYATNAVSGAQIEPAFHSASLEQLDAACAAADSAFEPYRHLTGDRRAAFLEAIAEEILALGSELIDRGEIESGLPRARLEGERGRTVGQLRAFAEVARSTDYLGVRIAPAQPDRQPAPAPDLRLMHIPLGPVAVFGASNFPLAFSVAGGDTAAALAAGCPVIVKAHPAHPGVSEMVGRAVMQAAARTGMPAGSFSLLHDSGVGIAQALVADPRIKAVGFTGSRNAGHALMRIAASRPEPIPVFAEMSSINPVLLFPDALDKGAEAIAGAFASAVTLGAGQFCTNPGLLLAVGSPSLDRFIQTASEAMDAAAPQTMLTPAIRQAYSEGVDHLTQCPAVTRLTYSQADDPRGARPALFSCSARDFAADPSLGHEVFGPSSLLVRCDSLDELYALLQGLEGQLTVSLHLAADDYATARRFIALAELKAGRLVFGGFGTGVEVSPAMVHGGPYPSTSDGRSTSVGTLAIYRFLRPVCYQNAPNDLLPDALQA